MGIKSVSFELKFRRFSSRLQDNAEVKSLSDIGHCAHFGQWSGRTNWLIPPSGRRRG